MSLSIIIPFLNEGINVEKTLTSIFSTVKGDVEVVLINDASDDDFAYESVAKQYHCEYVRNSFRVGVAACRDLGVKLASNEAVMFLDAHMQFFQTGWDKLVLERVLHEPNTIFCARSVYMNLNWEVVSNAPQGCGAFIPFENVQDFLATKWLINPTDDHSIPCIFGAAYCFNKSFYEQLGGLSGLLQWGGDEQFLSAKAFMFGGRCALLPELSVGHVYREIYPYECSQTLNVYNQLYIASVLQPKASADRMVNRFLNSVSQVEGARDLLDDMREEVQAHREYYLSFLNKRSFAEFLAYNEAFRHRH
ncbi:glycosyltransferase [Pseudoalteromonas luteoviolacea]|uniref:glycosyltransferase n=1 Tax=Pseudoalteromonas luteoviolacea TaxID=43657 RepID=UPI001B3878CE|nr:glycosyltransferase [Pseudoalteromonas luteoviolacea]MBQ4837046.1 glycosyltransferase [Pseudoalteromonas luteoviolacea]